MANFSSFFPSAGAAGGGIGQTITVGDYSYPNAISISDFDKTKVRINHTATQNAAFMRVPSTSSPTSYVNTPTANNTYATLANITSATNGGGIYFLGAAFNYASPNTISFHWRITIDGGTAVEIGSARESGRSQHVMMGGGYEIASPHANTTAFNSGMHMAWGNSTSDHQSVASAWATNYYSQGQYYSSTGNSLARTRIIVYPAEHQAIKGLPYIYFSSSCLVEYKALDNAGAWGSSNGYAMIKTF